MKKTTLILASSALLLGGAFTAHAQNAVQPELKKTTTKSSYRAADDFGPRAEEWEFTLGGSGSSNKSLDHSLGGVNFSVGYFTSSTFEIAVRQTVNYSNPAGSNGTQYDGSTFLALDQHFDMGRFRPFVGLNFGGLYGESTTDTWAAGLEGGLKYYVQPKTFLFALLDYEWTFKNSDAAGDNFDSGAFLWTMGVGFNF
jgi:hypothetical protein